MTMNKKNPGEEFALLLAEGKIPQSPEAQLRSKIQSILRSIENLSQKKMRIEFEIKRQKKSLERKRLELKKSKASSTSKLTLSIENQHYQFPSGIVQKDIENLDSYLLSESSRILEE